VKRQRAWVIALSLVLLAIFMPAATDGWQTHGTFGMRISRAENLVRAVTPNSPADEAGIEPGDRIDVAALGIAGHLSLMAPRPGTTLHLRLERGGAARSVTLTAIRAERSATLRWLVAGAFVSTAAFIIVGALLVYLRPAPMTWWLWLFCAGIVPVNDLLDFYAFLPAGVQTVTWLFARTFLGGFSAFPLMPFVLRFPNDRIAGWRRRVRVPAIALTAVLLAFYATIAWVGLTRGLDHYSLLNGLPALGVYLFSAILLVLTFVNSEGAARQRLKWAVTGMLTGFVAQVFVYVPAAPWVSPFAGIISIVMPLSVAYAALRHRLVDADFVINRAIVYGALTAMLISIVSLVDFVVSQLIGEYHFALYVEAAASIAIGFALDRFRAQLDRLTDRLFFQGRHRAEAQIDRVGRSLEYAQQTLTIRQALVDEPLRWLVLASAALFEYDADAAMFRRTYAHGWSDDHLADIGDDANVVRFLRDARAPLGAKDVAWEDATLPSGAAAPALYVPVFRRERLSGIVIYGGHLNTTTLDPAEVTLLAVLGRRSAVAFDHIAYDAMEARLQAAGLAAGLTTIP
jgi:hypothetical protein